MSIPVPNKLSGNAASATEAPYSEPLCKTSARLAASVLDAKTPLRPPGFPASSLSFTTALSCLSNSWSPGIKLAIPAAAVFKAGSNLPSVVIPASVIFSKTPDPKKLP